MSQYPTKSHYPDTKLTSLCPMLLMLSIKLGNDKYKFCKSLVLIGPGNELTNYRYFTQQKAISGFARACPLPRYFRYSEDEVRIMETM